MKIYSYIRMGWDEKTQAYKTIESTFEEYHGEIAQCFGIGSLVGGLGGFFFGGPVGAAVGAGLGGMFDSDDGSGSDVNVPGPSTIEQELQQEQLNILREQQRRGEQMDPHLLRSMGLIQDPDTTTPAQYEQRETPGETGKGTYYNEYGQSYLPVAVRRLSEDGSTQFYDEKGQPVNYGDLDKPTAGSWEQVETSPAAITPGGIRAMTQDEWSSSMTIPEKEAYEMQLAQRKQQTAMYGFQQEQWQAQQDQWERAETESAAMKPFLLESMGLVEEDGVYRQQTEKERYAQMTTLERGQYGLTLQAQQRQRRAYAGQLPISPALEASLGKQETQIVEALSQRLGTNWQLTTPGQQAMGAFRQRADLVREEARRGEMSTQGGLLLANLGYLGGSQAQQMAQRGLFSQGRQIPSVQSVQQVGGMQNIGGAYAAYPQTGSGAFAGYGMLQQPYQQQRQMQLQASMYNQQAQTQQTAGLWGGLGQLAGAGINAYGMYKSMGMA